ncbi:MAG: hypothetical protein ACR2NB_03485 [Solirubrobacteraceae bacterium]
MAALDREALHGRWVHSHEEDTDAERIYRPAGFAFPPARGSTALDLRPDGTYVETGPGPVDAPVESAARPWSLDGDALVLGADGEEAERTWQIAGATRDRLTVRR